MLRIGGASSLAELELQEPACGKPAWGAAGSALAQSAEALHEVRPLPVTQERLEDGVLPLGRLNRTKLTLMDFTRAPKGLQDSTLHQMRSRCMQVASAQLKRQDRKHSTLASLNGLHSPLTLGEIKASAHQDYCENPLQPSKCPGTSPGRPKIA